MLDVDVKKLIRNIKSLAKNNFIKITDLERMSDVSQGYLSRIENSNYETRPNIVIIKKMADALNVGIDVLLNYDLTNVDKDSLLVINKINSIKEKTEANLIEWYFETDKQIKEFTNLYDVCHPLYTRNSSHKLVYNSFFASTVDCIEDDLLSFNLNDDRYYLVKFISKKQSFLEFVVIANDVVRPICGSYEKDELGASLNMLYSSAYKNSRRIKITDDVLKYLKQF